MRMVTEAELRRQIAEHYAEDRTYVGCIPRKTTYGGVLAGRYGLRPVSDTPDMIPDWKDAKEIINACNARRIFPVYHEKETGLLDKWYQGRLPRCWAWSLTAAVIDIRALAGLKPVPLAPTSLGWLTSWKSAGYYLDAAINGCKDRGIAPASCVPDMHAITDRDFASNWKQEALNYRVLEWWDTNRNEGYRTFAMQCLAILRTGHPGYAAWNSLRHAMCVEGMQWDDSNPEYPIVWVIRNSHGELEPITMAGKAGTPDEFYGPRTPYRETQAA